jgi:hypothetical protein
MGKIASPPRTVNPPQPELAARASLPDPDERLRPLHRITEARRRVDCTADEMGIHITPFERDVFALLLIGMEDES